MQRRIPSFFVATAPRLMWAAIALAGCGSEEAPTPPLWQQVYARLPGALLSVWGTASNDVWAVGTAPGPGEAPTVLHYDGSTFEALDAGEPGDLWWAFGFESGPVYLGGSGGLILRYEAGVFTRLATPGTGTVFGIWGSSPDNVWAVGGEAGGSRGAFAWRLTGDSWQAAAGFPSALADTGALWKVFGRGSSDVWMVGTGGKTLHWDGAQLAEGFIGIAESLFTVHANSEVFATVGGFASGLLLERPTGDASAAWQDRSPADSTALIGVCLTETSGYAVGQFGYVATRGPSGWTEELTGFEADVGARSLHSVWIDPDQGVWAAGGQVIAPPLTDGVLLHRGASLPAGAAE